ncbi:MAG: hypothetical protein QXF88_02845 [Candidatus Aenigmatarchaeota archaeon]
MKKAQITVEYIVAFTIFIGVIGYVYINYSRSFQPFLMETEKEEKYTEAFQISELMLNDLGDPTNWNTLSLNQIKRVGLSENLNKQNYLSSQKITALQTICQNNYADAKRLIGAEKNFHMFIFSIDGNGNRNSILSCVPPNIVREQINVTVKRYANTNNGQLIELMIQV